MYLDVTGLDIPEDILIRLTDDEGSGSVNTARASAAISAAQSFIDAALSRSYDVPLADPPDAVKKAVADVARYYLHRRVGPVPAEVETAYHEAERFVERAADGVCILGGGPDSSGPAFTYSPREFSREQMGGF